LKRFAIRAAVVPNEEGSLFRRLFQTKSLDEILKSAEHPQHALRRTLGPIDITLLGIGAIIGTGVFAAIGTATSGDLSRPGAGPSLMLSFVITAVVCGFTALCYAEFASLVPVSGSAYTYSYATLGEIVAWIIGWDLIIEYAIGNVAVAISWSNYFRVFLRDLGIHIPMWLATDFRTAGKIFAQDPAEYARQFGDAPMLFGHPIIVNVLAFGIVLLITIVLVWGIRESVGFNAVMVAIKIAVLLFFVVVSLYFVSPVAMEKNWHPFQPQGWGGTLAGAAVIFFAYIGFDAVSTVAEEAKKPTRDLPIGIMASLGICTLFYIVIAAAFTGLVPFDVLKGTPANNRAEPLTFALAYVAPHARWATVVLAFGSVVAQTAVLLVFQLGQPRIFFSMARDGLLPPVFAAIHPKFKTPHITTILTGLVVGSFAAVGNIDEMVDLTNIGTLFAFVLVCVGITVLRKKDPNRSRPFRVPLGDWFLPMLGAAACLGLMYYLPPSSWWRFAGWLVLGLAVYSSYGYTHSTVGQRDGRPRRAPVSLKLAAVGFLAAAVGLFLAHIEPGIAEKNPEAGLIRLIKEAFQPGAQHQVQALSGVLLIVLGSAIGIGGLWRGSLVRVAPGDDKAEPRVV
jgi:APA family basic amino acid/polyamine antiporter